MSRQTHRLSTVKVTHAKVGIWPDGNGLYLQVTEGADKTLRKNWFYRFSRSGHERRMGLGPLHEVGLAEARELADAARRLHKQGVDPIEHRNAELARARLDVAKAITFDAARDAYVKSHGAGWRNTKHAKQWTATLRTYATPLIGSLPVQSIDTGLVVRCLEPIWSTKPETASRVRGRIEAILDWAKVSGYRDGENPARWRGHLDKLLPERSKVHRVRHHPAMPYSEIAAFMADVKTHEGIAAEALQFTTLTAARTGETIGAKWPEFDLMQRVWTVPADRMKGGKTEHVVPLSDAAVDVLKGMAEIRENDAGYVFPGADAGAGLSNMAMLELLRGMRPGLTVHGFRSTFRDWAADCTTFPDPVVEMALAHAVSDKTIAAYKRTDLLARRRELMDAWAAFCTRAPADAILPQDRPKRCAAVAIAGEGGWT